MRPEAVRRGDAGICQLLQQAVRRLSPLLPPLLFAVTVGFRYLHSSGAQALVGQYSINIFNNSQFLMPK